jgi:hypothetical protein
VSDRPIEPFDEGGDAACWAHLVCPACGAVTDGGETHHCPDACEGEPSKTT